ncbi:formimidoylglutamase [Mucilaginibacter myungsuensis]|uniref:Formimidoylglutamase n=1 Tax=Mucilaginibacter myungsuensis TaxID=649104 RepID=A0A929KUY4_9SPHI|nr:formimidoylglutamase [Mucilaginibacter myungsuensis]MBE9662049.1 formimidoylglutamase [Mucilaginibacter myungsuensis]MDN3599518.1 formimidoylglutamase [Mucilaginibacter myungsuensis]
MSLSDFFAPIDLKKVTPKTGFFNSHLGSKIEHHSVAFPDLENEKFDIAIIGVLDDRNAVGNPGCALGPDYVREKLYSLYEGAYTTKIADLGNIKQGASVTDTYYAVKTVVSELVKKDILPVIIGGGQDLTYAQYLAYEDLEQKVDLVVIDPRFDLEDDSNAETIETTSGSYLNKIFLHEPNYLFNFSNLGYQTYFVNQDSLRVMDKLYFDTHRLGELMGNVAVAEPIIRNASMISFDMGAIRSSDAVGNANATPNGFYGEEACQICRYAGFNDKLTSIGFYEFNPAYDSNGQTATLLSQMIWYFIDGFYNRKKDFPLNPKSQYLIYKTTLKHDDHELVFVKSKKSDRWWMQVPYPTGGSQNSRFHLVPCRYDDYKMATTGEMPDLWWRTYQKLS